MGHEPHDSGPVITVSDLANIPLARAERAMDRWGAPTVLLVFVCVGFWLLYTGKLDDLMQAQAATQRSIEAHVNQMNVDRTEWRFYLRALCVNSADSEAERANCVPPSEAR